MLAHVAAMLTPERIQAAADADIEHISVQLLRDASCIVANCLTRPLPAENDQVRDDFAEAQGLVDSVVLLDAVGADCHLSASSDRANLWQRCLDCWLTRARTSGLQLRIPWRRWR